jgi:hypothetical protein
LTGPVATGLLSNLETVFRRRDTLLKKNSFAVYRCRIPFKFLYDSLGDRRKYRVSTSGHHLCILVIGELAKLVGHINGFSGIVKYINKFFEKIEQITAALTFNRKAEDRFSAGKIKRS